MQAHLRARLCPRRRPSRCKCRCRRGKAGVYLINAGGWTLTPGSYAISVDGQRAAKLPRSTYAFVVVEAGIHVLQSTNVKFDLTAEAGHKYYVVVAYRPEKSWAVSLVGHSFFFGEVPEEKGQAMLRAFTYKGT